MALLIGSTFLASAGSARKDAMITGGEHVLTAYAPSTGTQYMIRYFTFGGDVWHVFVAGRWLSAHTSEASALGVLRRVGIKVS